MCYIANSCFSSHFLWRVFAAEVVVTKKGSRITEYRVLSTETVITLASHNLVAADGEQAIWI